jgi:homoserine O-acetyltransferase/O-succinyltransferase
MHLYPLEKKRRHMHSTNIFNYQENFTLESGQILAGLHLQYSIFGQLNADKSNVIWVIHALTANDNPIDWWPGVVGKGYAIDPSKHCIICVNNPGSPYGSIGPLSNDKNTGQPYYHDFPIFTTRDIAKSFSLLRQELGITSIGLLIGASLGGQIAMEWAIQESGALDKLILLATNARHSPWGIAFNESQRLAIEADQTFKDRNQHAGQHGLKAARSIALLSYRSIAGYNTSQQDDGDKIEGFKSSSYQQYQGDKLVNRFDAFSYYALTKTMDSHNVGRGRQSIEEALASIAVKTVIVGIATDLLFPIGEQRYLAKHIPEAEFIEITSDLGHDGFLTESDKVSRIIYEALYTVKEDNVSEGIVHNARLAYL